MSYPPYDPGGWEPPLPADWFEQPENWGSSAAPQGRELVPSGELGLPLPPPGQLQEWLAAIVQRDGLEALLSALLRAVAREDFMAATEKLCNIQWGEEPLFSTETGAARWESPRASPARSTTSTVDTIALPSTPSNTGEVPSLFRFKRCWHCEPAFGRADEICQAQEVLGSLEAEAEEQDEEVLQAEVGEASRLARRAARYYLYRKWVFLAHGRLGKRVRVRIPPCVIELIRARYPEPGCNCAPGTLHLCTAHGYTGHREACPDEGDENV